MPIILVQALSDQIEPISAEERLEYLIDTAVASGAVKRDTAQRHQRMLIRHTRPEKRTATPDELAAMGIEFRG